MRRKLIALVIIAAIVVLLTSKTTSRALTGDINGDGVVNAIDLAMVQKHLLEVETLEGLKKYLADVNKDGSIDIVDLAEIQKIILKGGELIE